MDDQRPPEDEQAPTEPTPPEPQAPPDEEVRPPGRRLRWRRVVLVAALALVGLGLAGFGYFYATSPALRAVIGTALRGRLSPKRAFPGRDQVTVLVLGRDVDIGPQGQVLDTPGRTDLILVTRMDFERRRAVLLSIPRDLLVRIPGRRGLHKINAAHAHGGPRLAVRTVDRALGIRCDHYVVADYDAVTEAIDAIGGVGLRVDQDMDYDDSWGHLHIHLKKGQQRLNGEQAVGFARFRKSNTGRATSDLSRIQRQHALARALAAEVRQPRTWLRLPGALDVTRRGMTTDLSFDQLACLGCAAARLPQGAIALKTLPVRPTPHALVLDADAPEDFTALLSD